MLHAIELSCVLLEVVVCSLPRVFDKLALRYHSAYLKDWISDSISVGEKVYSM